MNCLEWNNILANHFFNPNKSGKDVYLYISKSGVIEVARSSFNKDSSDSSIWSDFLYALQSGLPDSAGKIGERARHCYEQYDLHHERINYRGRKMSAKFPPYIIYLVLFVLPLIEEVDGKIHVNNYYTRLNRFLKNNRINQQIGIEDFRDNQLNRLWNDLEVWCNVKMKGDVGRFRVVSFKNPNWVYVGKPLSQCVLSPQTIAKFVDLFLKAGMIPNSFYTLSDFKTYILKFGLDVLQVKKAILSHIANDDELGLSILGIAKREYHKWTGETYSDLTGLSDIRKRDYTIASLILQFSLNQNLGEIFFSYRLFSTNDYPEDLNISGNEILYDRFGFSRKIEFPTNISLSPFEIRDDLNKWICRFPEKKNRIFVNGGYFQLSSEHWVETNHLVRTDWMFLLCDINFRQDVLEWGKHFDTNNFRDYSAEYDGIPDKYCLFKFLNPKISLPGISLLTVKTDKEIRLIDGLKLGFRTYLRSMLPLVEVVNSEDYDEVLLKYKDQEFILEKLANGKWLLPSNIRINEDFFVNLKNQVVEGDKQAYQILGSKVSDLANGGLVQRSKFNLRPLPGEEYVQGNAIFTNVEINPTIEGQTFNPVGMVELDDLFGVDYKQNFLLDWLIAKRICGLKSFNEAFEIIFSRYLNYQHSALLQSRSACLSLLDRLGYVDYDYSTDSIVALPPKLISIPADKGRRAMLIGCRDENLIMALTKWCALDDSNIKVSIENHDFEYSDLMLPDSIFLEAKSQQIFKSLSSYLNIEYDEWYILKMKHIIPSIKEYEQFIFQNLRVVSREDNEWARRIFNCATLKFEREATLVGDYSFVEYEYTPYWKEYGIWADGEYYEIKDKSWGKYLIINHLSEKEYGYEKNSKYSRPKLIYNSNNSLAIPARLPLPKIMSRILHQISGRPPSFRKLSLDGKPRWFNVHHNIPSLFIDNFFRFKLNMNIERTTETLSHERSNRLI